MFRCVAVIGMLVAVAGCQGDSRPANERYVPDLAVAERALTVVLDSWKAGTAVPSTADDLEILLIDAWRRDGRQIDDYRILGAQPWDGGRRFVVELTMSDEAEPLQVRYVVVGIQPLMVFRQEDFDMLANWMHPMTETDAASAESESTDQDSEK